jgi:CDP-diglyceride synthetase
MKGNDNKILKRIELISILVYIAVGILFKIFSGVPLTLLLLTLLTFTFLTLMIVFRKHHIYIKEKPLMTAFSIYYKTLVYIVIMFNFCDLHSGRNLLVFTAMISAIIYSIFAYFFGKKYNEILNAYLYVAILGIGRGLSVL